MPNHATTAETKWAGSPWHVVEYGDGDQLVICSDVAGNWRICFMATHGGSRSSWEKIQAEAALISAAPDLYEALADLCRSGGPDDGGDVFEKAKAALAKARGEATK